MVMCVRNLMELRFEVNRKERLMIDIPIVDVVTINEWFILAASKDYQGGYKNQGWITGEFDHVANSDYPAVDEVIENLQYAQ
ncbi:hypothetical protein Leryth_011638 [Lithospermum erythrorhizon]|nr:hypothetical protein Leryth_011638 [Lithospermum erythrorhizon]